MSLRRGVPLALAVALVVAIASAAAGANPGPAGPQVCSGTLHKPGLLKGTYSHGVVVTGVCAVKTGPAHVIGTLTVTKGSTLEAAYGLHGARLTVTGDLVLDKGATLFLGCKVNPNGTGFACFDEPNLKHPTLASHGMVSGSIIEHSALAVIVHNSAIGKNLTQIGGGGGLNCGPRKHGIFAAMKSPAFTAYEDGSIGGNVKVSAVHTCFLAIARVTIGGNTRINRNETKDPDAIEVLSNHIELNLSCHGNRHPKGEPSDSLPIWDSRDLPPKFALYPRESDPNIVGGTRSGQCVKASPIKPDGPPAAKHF
jgi:hypothetical protein